MQFTRVEAAKLFVTTEECGQLRRLFCLVTGEKHPKILYCRSMSCVIKIDNMDLVLADENIAWMEVGMYAQISTRSGSLVTSLNAVQDHFCNAFVGREQIGRNEIMFKQVFAGRRTITVDINCRSVTEVAKFSNEMDSCNEATQLSQQLVIIEIGRSTTVAGINGDSEWSRQVQCSSGNFQRRHHR